MRPSSGLTFGGRYQLTSRIAIGGMGEVWQATDLVIGRTVAIKILKDEYLGDPGFLERFRAEARHAALVNHEGIANVFDYGEEDGSAYLVMELVPGEALSAIIERERVLPTDKVLDIVAQTALALQAAHAAGLVHRDIKPGNLLITPDGRVKITDFGIARIADQVPLTATGQVMGTVQYLSPEQASGHPASPATDIYSLGIVAYEALAGKRPFTGESQVAIAMAQINEAPPELPVSVSEPVRNLVYSCIAKNPSDRPATAAHLARAAQALLMGDVAAAAAAVPGILGDRSIAAMAGPNYGQPTAATTQATRLLPAQGPVATPPEPIPTRRNPWMWPLIAIISVLAIVLAGIIIALVANPSGGGDTPATSSSPPATSSTPTSRPTPSTSPTTPTTVLVDESLVLNRDRDTVTAYLTELGLQFNLVDGTAAQAEEQVGLAYTVTPSGNVRKTETVTVTFYGPVAEVVPPSQPGALSGPASPQAGGSEVTVTWPIYSGCPAGHPHTGFNFQLDNTNASVVGGTGRPPGDTSVVIQLPEDPDETVNITYTAVCTDMESPTSAPLTYETETP